MIRLSFQSTFLVVVIALISAFRSAADEPLPAKIRVLFIGNSYTHTYSIPVQIKNLFAAKGVVFEHESETPGGFWLKDHWSGGKALLEIRRGGWDYVVLQDHSTAPFLYRQELINEVVRFDAEIRKVGARTLLYQTWPPSASPERGPYINETYRLASMASGAGLVPVGTGWPAGVAAVGSPAMYSDDRHPSHISSYLSALTFYRTMSRLGTLGLPKTNDITLAQATSMQNVADGVPLAPAVAPEFNLPAGVYSGSQRVTLSTPTARATIHYTTDGSTPTAASAQVPDGSVISISETVTLRALAIGTGTTSAVTAASYVITATNGQTLLGNGSVNRLVTAWPGLPANLATDNPGFETGVASPWVGTGTNRVVDGTFPYTGTFSARVTAADSGYTRTVGSLQANTTYESVAWYRPGTDSSTATWSVNAFSSPSVTVSTTAPNRGSPLAWLQMARRFTTGAASTSANLVFQQTLGSGAFDDLQVFKVPQGYELGLKFRSAAAGRITALRVFRPIDGPTAYTLRLWDGGGNVLNQVSVSNLTATGWIEVPLPTPRTITADTNYVASYGVAEGGFYQATRNGLQTSIVNGALSSVLDSNGVYALARGTSPAISTASNYWTDVRFIPNTPLENWRTSHFTAAELGTPSLEATRWGHLANPDGDLYNNLLEYALDRSPLVPESTPGTTGSGFPLSLTFKRARADVTYTVQTSRDLTTWTGLASNPGSVGETITTTTTNESDRFIRLRVSQ